MSDKNSRSYYIPPSKNNGRANNDNYPLRSYGYARSGYPRSGYNSGRPPLTKKQRAERARKRRIIRTASIVMLSLASILIIVISGILLYAGTILDKIDYTSGEEMVIPDNLDDVEIAPEEDEGADGSAAALSDEELEALRANLSKNTFSEDELFSQQGVTNILLLGTDNRSSSSKGARSDAIILLSINSNTKQLIMTSIMRDVYVIIPGRTQPAKLNAAHAYGGPALTIKAIESAFGIKIDRYVSVDFYAFIDIVDALGGITLDVSENEREVMNNYIHEINVETGRNVDDGKLWVSGKGIKVTGKQALGYVRNRYTRTSTGGHDDYGRTERQRVVLDKVIEKLKTSNPVTLLSVLDATAGHMSTDYSKSELVALASNVLDYKDYAVVQIRVPSDESSGAMVDGQAVLQIDFLSSRKTMFKVIYGIE